MQAALQTQHMGKVIRAFRLHRYHSRPISQESVGKWMGRGQRTISRLEVGPPPTDLQELRYWTNVLSIPERYLWFAVSDKSSYKPSPLASLTVHEAKRHIHQLSELFDEIMGTEGESAASTLQNDDESPPPSAANAPVLTGPLAGPPVNIDIERAEGPRMGDYLLGGTANFRVDREVIDFITSALPGGVETARAVTQASQDFQRRALRYLAGQGIRQFLQTGAGLPRHIRPHEVIYDIVPDAQVLYVMDHDTVLAHVRELQRGPSAAATRWTRSSVSDTPDLLGQAERELDFDERIGVLMVGSLKVFPDVADAHTVITELLGPMASGSHLVTSHLTTETLGAEIAEVVYRFKSVVDEGRVPHLALRTRAEVAQLLDRLELVEPGIVPVDQWRPEQPPAPHTFIYGAVAGKP